MDRRNFFKILSTVSAGAATTACGTHATDTLIPLLVADHEIFPGEEHFHPHVCTACNAGCGTLVRVMRGERTITRNGEKLREPIAAIKKIEGNPLDPISGGRLCARGQAEVQSLYHPDRLQGAMRRSGNRGAAQFTAITWDEAIGSLAEKLGNGNKSKILFLTSAPTGTRTQAIQRFLDGIGAPPAVACGLGNLALERQAAEAAFGWKGVPVYDLAQARYVVSIGADFLGTWASPVFYSRQYGHFRQGRPDLRGRLVHAESRMSLTASNADEWIPIQPGGELAFTLALARVLLEEKLAKHENGVPAEALKAIRSSAPWTNEKQLRRIARELGASPAPLVIAGASLPRSNSVQALIAAHYLNLMLGNVGQPGGMLPPSSDATERPQDRDLTEAIAEAQIVLLDSANPVYLQPASIQALNKAQFVASFGPFLDDSAAYADLLLPSHHPLESAMAVIPSVSAHAGVNVAIPFIKPLYETRAIEDTFNAVAKKMGATFQAPSPKSFVETRMPSDQTWEQVARQGGLWLTEVAKLEPTKPAAAIDTAEPVFSGDAAQYPMHFQPYLSLQYFDGRGAHLTWLKELPDPASSAMFSIPVEMDPQTAERLGVLNGDAVRVESPHGSIDAPVYIHPAAVPGVLSMAIGHKINPLTLLAPAFGATRVRLTKTTNAEARLIQFSTQDREEGAFGHR
jgi:anaerobic selenocysteine-containing dehydrogenase